MPGRARLCVADEHFVATLLSAYYMTESIDRIGRLTYTDWQGGGWHPATFYPGNVTRHIAQMRGVSDAAMCAPPLLCSPPALAACGSAVVDQSPVAGLRRRSRCARAGGMPSEPVLPIFWCCFSSRGCTSRLCWRDQ